MKTPLLYIKPSCPWCHEAIDFFKKHKVKIKLVDISKGEENRKKLHEISGQGKVPTLQYNEFILADFDTGELEDSLNKKPKIKKELGL